ncbi:4-amino-4-deoxychorismate lyase [Halarcobacter mediterraneus]|uniref:Endolytic murein transglycosylase n=2 Tax=Halarcobacter mediterraneus TaxID=2023153 RepID=A0A4Q1AYU2_9BACT|nr:4-amino-4-deoxychorismate lyase [Halarcobacter mediterraneus]
MRKMRTENKNRNIKISSLIAFSIIEFILLAIIAILFYVNIPLTSTKVLYIPKGSTKSIISHLNKTGYELNNVDKYIINFLGYPQSGWIDLKSQYMKKADFLYKLTTSKAALKTITLIPGETSYFFIKDIAQKFNLSEEKLHEVYNKYAYKKDGNILAETYSLPYGMKEDHLLFYLFSNTNKQYEEFSKKIFGYYDKKKWYYYIIMASIIQKEAASIDEMPLVSSVIYNRLKKGMALQMDGTLNYGEYSHQKVTAQKIREDNSSYNTYKNRGLPDNPVCAVSLNAIKAAIFPVKSDFLYFVRDNSTGLHKFTSSYKEHIRNININRDTKKTYTKVKKVENKFDKEAKKIMQTDVTKQKPSSIKSLWNNVK